VKVKVKVKVKIVNVRSLLFVVALLAANVDAADSTHAWKATKLSDGQPDMQGTWTFNTSTPFERPPELKDKPFWTEAEVANAEARARERWFEPKWKDNEVGRDNEAYIDTTMDRVLPSRRTSLIVHPDDGRVPLTAEAEQRRDYNVNTYDTYESMSPWDRCVTRGPTFYVPSIYNNAYQIVQTPGYIVLAAEMIHEARIIPLDGSKHADSRIRDWNGDSRGRFEGNTLVIDTTNFNGKGWIVSPLLGGRVRGVPFTRELHTVERFTRVSADRIDYQITIEDPTMYSAPWTMELPFVRDANYQMYEYACHEGNKATEMILGGARAQEKVKK
jgi:hypothetical protein